MKELIKVIIALPHLLSSSTTNLIYKGHVKDPHSCRQKQGRSGEWRKAGGELTGVQIHSLQRAGDGEALC